MLRTERERLLRVPHVARALDCSRPTVYRLVAAGTLPAIRLGTGPKAPIRVRESDLDRLVQGGTP